MKKELPPPMTGSNGLFGLPYEALKWEVLKTSVQLGLFDRLSDSRTSSEVAQALSLHPANTDYLLNALVALGCLSKSDGQYRNTELAERFLRTGTDTFIGEALLFMEQWMLPVLNGGLKQLLGNGPPPKKTAMGDPELWKMGARVSLNYSRCGRAQAMARLVSELPEFPALTRMLDMGAGPGILGLALAAAHPSLKCVIMDQPAVAEVAQETVAEYGMEARTEVRPGDYMQDDIGSGYDLIMANFTLNFYRDRLGELMDKVLASLNPGGIFLVTSDGLSRDGTAPAATVISWLSTKLLGSDMSFETGQISRAMLDAGFVSIERRTLTDIELEAHGPVEMTIGRKEMGY